MAEAMAGEVCHQPPRLILLSTVNEYKEWRGDASQACFVTSHILAQT